MTSHNFHELWSRATPLNNAWIELSREDFDRRKWRALRRSPTNDFDFPETVELGGWLPSTLEGRQAKLWLIERMEKTDLVSRLFEGELWAIGYRTQPHSDDTPSRVPRDFFFVDDPDELKQLVTNWAKGEVRSQAGSYFDVRVMGAPDGGHSSTTRELLKHSREMPPSPSEDETTVIAGSQSAFPSSEARRDSAAHAEPPSKEGRPNSRTKVQQMALQLWTADAHFRAMRNRTDQAREIKAQMFGEDYRYADEMAGYRLEVVRRWIGQVLRKPKP